MDRPAAAAPRRPRTEWVRVVADLEQLCEVSQHGDKIPTHTELMRRLNASERTVLHALADLQRRGRIERRHGSGTYVSHRKTADFSAPDIAPPIADSTIVAVMRPDRSVYDQCLTLLYGQAEQANLTLTCKLVGSDRDFAQILSSATSPSRYILFNYAQTAQLAQALQLAGNRVVIVGTPYIEGVPVAPCVHGDQEEGGYLAARALIDVGHDRIAFTNYLESQITHPRLVGHRRAVAEAAQSGRSVVSTIIHDKTTVEWDADPAKAAKFFSAPNAPTGLVCWNDHEAARVVSTLVRAGVRVPDDVSVVGYDNLAESRLIVPALTTIDGNIQAQIKAAVRLLMQDTPTAPGRTVVFMPTLVKRESVSKPNFEINGDHQK